jgi:hypothetical protein
MGQARPHDHWQSSCAFADRVRAEDVSGGGAATGLVDEEVQIVVRTSRELKAVTVARHRPTEWRRAPEPRARRHTAALRQQDRVVEVRALPR